MALLGLSKLLGKDAKQFVLLDRDTDGRAGRPVYIDVALASTFGGLERSQQQLVHHRMKQLRATAAGSNSYSNLNDAFEHKMLIGAAFVHYKVFQSTGSATHGPGVYITKMVVASYKGDGPGIYKVERSNKRWKVGKRTAKQIETNFAAINGGTRDLIQAGTMVLPELISHAYSDKKWEGDLNRGFALFYNPPCLYDQSGEWRTPEQKTFSKGFASRKLKDALLDAARRKHKVQWLVHSDGAHLFHNALRILPGIDLSNHTVLFAAPTKDISAILPDLNKTKMRLHDEVMRVQDSDWRSKTAQMWHYRRLERELMKTPGFEDQARFLGSLGSKDLRSYFLYLGSAALTGVAIATPAMPTVASLAASGVAALALWDKAQNVRNIAANNIQSPGLNPHMHPFDTNDQMNHRARKHSGRSLQTFVDVVKAKFQR